MISRTIEIAGTAAVLHGMAEDADFANLDIHAAQMRVLADAMIGLDDGAIVFDAGVRIGLSTVLAARLTRFGTVYAVEGVASRYACLRQTVIDNKLTNCRLVRAMLGDCERFMTAALEPSSGQCVRGPDQGAGHPDRVFCTTIDQLVEQIEPERLDLIKIEASGFEQDVLAGAQRTITRFNPVIVVAFQPYAIWKYGAGHPHGTARFAFDHFRRFTAYTGERQTPIHSTSAFQAYLAEHESQLGRFDYLVFGGNGR